MIFWYLRRSFDNHKQNSKIRSKGYNEFYSLNYVFDKNNKNYRLKRHLKMLNRKHYNNTLD